MMENPISTEWQPIETAPKNGTPILLWATREGWEETGYNRIVGYWDSFGWSIAGAGGPEPKASENEDGTQSWKVQRLDQCAPSHWMPLPSPPTR